MKFFDKAFWITLICFIFLIGIICFFPYWFTNNLVDPKLSFENTGQIGDTIGGIMGPFIAIVASFLTFLAFWAQFKANQQQRKDIQLERLESKFYDMLKLHRDNVIELNIKNKYTGRKVFIRLYNEFRFGYYSIKKIIDELPVDKKELYKIPTNNFELEALLCNLSYMVFYIGIGKNSNKILKEVLINRMHKDLIDLIINYFSNQQIKYYQTKNDSNPENKYLSLSYADDRHRLYMYYKPFDGHLIRLGHYYRHLIQSVKMIHEHAELSLDDKYSYLRNLRAQLSGHEQVMLYYNALSDFGTEWFNKPFFTDYAMIRNIPLSLADFGILPQEHPKIKPFLDKDPTILEGIELKNLQKNGTIS